MGVEQHVVELSQSVAAVRPAERSAPSRPAAPSWRDEATIPIGVEHVPALRRRVFGNVVDRGTDLEVAHDVALVLTELVANAVRHANPLPSEQLTVAWGYDELVDVIWIDVTDGGGSSEPHVVSAGPWDSSGRGLALVEALAATWGVQRIGHRRTVWARIPAQPATLSARVTPTQPPRSE